MIKKILHISLIFGVAAILTSCMLLPPDMAQMNADIKDIKLGLSSVNQNQKDLYESFNSDIEQIKTKETQNFDYIIASLNRLEEKLNAIETEVSVSRGQLEELKFKIAKSGNIKDMNLGSDIIAETPNELKPKTSDAIPVTLFDAAHNDYAKGNYEIAIQEFQQFIKDNPKSELVSDAQYWIGDCYYKLNNYKKALDILNMFTTTYPNTKFTPSAFLKIALCYNKLNYTSEYKDTLQTIVQKYPKFEEIDRVKQMLKDAQ